VDLLIPRGKAKSDPAHPYVLVPGLDEANNGNGEERYLLAVRGVPETLPSLGTPGG
jgi:hypothetical protein